MEAFDLVQRMEMLLGMIAKETEILDLERKIGTRVHNQIDKNQREYYLREQLRAINRELGDGEDRGSEIEEYRQRMEGRKLPDYVLERLEKEFARLSHMPTLTAEGNVVENYIDWVLDMPWGEYTEDNLDLAKAEAVLNEDHFGLTKVKERILEFLAVRQLTNSLKGPILCLVGPPGVGKTSLAASIARALDRKYVRLSLGGVHDEAEIRGHRRTYIGSQPGRIMQYLKNAGTSNPLFLLDEIDKMASDFRGDRPALCWRFWTRPRTTLLATIIWKCLLTFPRCCLSPPPMWRRTFPNRCGIEWRLCGWTATLKMKKCKSLCAT